MTITEIDKLVCRSIVVVDSQGRERITLGLAGDCAEIQVHDGIEDTDNKTTSVSLFAERGDADVYVSNGSRAVRLGFDGVEMEVFDDSTDDVTRWAKPSTASLEDLGIDAIKALARLIKRLPEED